MSHSRTQRHTPQPCPVPGELPHCAVPWGTDSSCHLCSPGAPHTPLKDETCPQDTETPDAQDWLSQSLPWVSVTALQNLTTTHHDGEGLSQ